MTKRRKIDASKVIEAVESGRLSKEVMDAYGLEKPSEQPRRRGRRQKDADSPALGEALADVTITKRGSLVLPKALVEKLGLSAEDSFIVRRTKAGMILKPV